MTRDVVSVTAKGCEVVNPRAIHPTPRESFKTLIAMDRCQQATI